jgi:integrase
MRKITKSHQAEKTPKRADGFGSEPYLRADGRWQSEIMVGVSASGRRLKKTVYGATSAECSAKLKDVMQAVGRNEVVTGRSPALIDWLDHWVDNLPKSRMRPRTLKTVRGLINNWVRDTNVARVRLDKVTPEHIESLYKAMRDAGRSEATAARLHSVLSRAFRVAQQRRKIGVPPTSLIDAPRPDAFKPVVLNQAQLQSLVSAAMASTDAARWMFALTFGPRQGEVLGLSWDDIDLETGRLRIRRELYRLPWKHGCSKGEPVCGKTQGRFCPMRRGGGWFSGEPKTDGSDREIYMPEQLIELFRDHKRVQAETRKNFQPFVSANGERIDLVFDRPDGRCREDRRDWEAWKALLVQAGVPAIRLHDARHTAATSMLLMDVNPKVVMSLFGWTSPAMLSRYQHVLDEMKKDVAERLGAAWFDPAAPVPPSGGNVVSLADFRKPRPAQGASTESHQNLKNP